MATLIKDRQIVAQLSPPDLVLEPTDDPAIAAGAVGAAGVIAVNFPKFSDGRGYSIGRLLRELGLATPNVGLLTNIIACPGGDFCSLANAKSIPVAEAIQRCFDDLDYLHDIGELDLNISGCINACGHHHVGHIGILGVDKNGEEWYQITIGGNQGLTLAGGTPASVGKVIGPSFARADIPDVVERLIETYLELRDSEAERFVDVVQRIGIEPFKTGVYGNPDQKSTDRHAALAA